MELKEKKPIQITIIFPLKFFFFLLVELDLKFCLKAILLVTIGSKV